MYRPPFLVVGSFEVPQCIQRVCGGDAVQEFHCFNLTLTHHIVRNAAVVQYIQCNTLDSPSEV